MFHASIQDAKSRTTRRLRGLSCAMSNSPSDEGSLETRTEKEGEGLVPCREG